MTLCCNIQYKPVWALVHIHTYNILYDIIVAHIIHFSVCISYTRCILHRRYVCPV